MAVEIHTYPVDGQSLRTSVLSILFWISDQRNLWRNYEFVLTCSSVYCMLNPYLYRGVDISAGHLASHDKYRGMLP